MIIQIASIASDRGYLLLMSSAQHDRCVKDSEGESQHQVRLMSHLGLDWHDYIDGLEPQEDQFKGLQERPEDINESDHAKISEEASQKKRRNNS